MDYHKNTIERLKEIILFKRIKKLTDNVLILDDNTKINFECTEYDCSSSANGTWTSIEIDGLVTDVQLVDIQKVEDEVCESQMIAKLVVLHNQNTIAQAQLCADNGCGDYYYSVLSVFVDNENIGKILESYYI